MNEHLIYYFFVEFARFFQSWLEKNTKITVIQRKYKKYSNFVINAEVSNKLQLQNTFLRFLKAT